MMGIDAPSKIPTRVKVEMSRKSKQNKLRGLLLNRTAYTLVIHHYNLTRPKSADIIARKMGVT